MSRSFDPEYLDPVDRAYYYWHGGTPSEDPADALYEFETGDDE